MTDDDYDVRNWATFGLAQQCEMDTLEIREALFARLSEDDHEIRGEALIGLAARKDSRVKDYILIELRGEFNGCYAFQAAEEFPDPEFLPELKRVREKYIDDMRSYHLRYLDDAIAACFKLS